MSLRLIPLVFVFLASLVSARAAEITLRQEIDALNIEADNAPQQQLPEGVLWEQNGWTVRFDNNVCNMYKWENFDGVGIDVIIKSPHIGIAFYNKHPFTLLQSKDKKNINAVLMFDREKIIPPRAFHFMKDGFWVLAMSLPKNEIENILNKNKLSLIVEGDFIGNIDLKGSTSAYKQLNICSNLLNY